MTATQVMVRLSTKPDPRALEGQIGPDIGWRRTEFWSVMPGLKYLAAIELDDHAAAEQHKAQIDSSSKLERELAVTKNYLEKTEQRASALLAIVGPRMDEVTRCKKAGPAPVTASMKWLPVGSIRCGATRARLMGALATLIVGYRCHAHGVSGSTVIYSGMDCTASINTVTSSPGITPWCSGTCGS